MAPAPRMPPARRWAVRLEPCTRCRQDRVHTSSFKASTQTTCGLQELAHSMTAFGLSQRRETTGEAVSQHALLTRALGLRRHQ
jgi:hypothetical protein